ncbi:MAG TPA: SBBP repeat-containing protein [Acidobacteriota bacterium]
MSQWIRCVIVASFALAVEQPCVPSDSVAHPPQTRTGVFVKLKSPDRSAETRLRTAYSSLLPGLEANQGQAPSDVKFLSRTSGSTLFLTETDLVVQLEKQCPNCVPSPPKWNSPNKIGGGPAESSRLPLRIHLTGVVASPEIEAGDQLEGKVNYLIGRNPTQWRTGIPTYATVQYRGVYPGIDVIYRSEPHQLSYEFKISPQGNQGAIAASFEGSSKLELDHGGDLIVSTLSGPIRQLRPLIHQGAGANSKKIAGHYVLRGGNQVGFAIGEHDRTQPLSIIATLQYDFPAAAAQGSVFATYLGGAGDDQALAIAVDTAGNAYVTGQTRSVNFPILGGAQKVNKGGWDVFVTKLNPSASAIIYSTYIGGSDDDTGFGIAVDPAGSAYIVGQTSSVDFPTVNSFQPAPSSSGGVAKSGDAGATWIDASAGLFNDNINSLAIDPGNTATLYAATLHRGVLKTTNSGGGWSAFNTGITTSAIYSLAVDPGSPSAVYAGASNGIVFSSVNGGFTWTSSSLGQNVRIVSLVVDPKNGRVVYAGTLGAGLFKSSDAGMTWTAVNRGLNSGLVYAVAIDPFNSSTLYAGTGAGLFKSIDEASSWSTASVGLPQAAVSALAIDPSNAVIVYSGTLGNGVFKSVNAGNSWSAASSGLTNQFVTALAVDPKDSSAVFAGTQDGVFKSTNGASTWSSASTGLNTLNVTALIIDPSDSSRLYVSTTSSPFDAFVAKLNASGDALVYSTYLGGTRRDAATAVAIDSAGDAYVTGFTDSKDFPVTGALQEASGGGSDVFITKLSSAGAVLLFSTYLGGNGNDVALGIALDSVGNAYVAGSTDSTNFPTTSAPLQSANAGFKDVFVAKIRSIGGLLLYSTYLGGENDDVATAIAIDQTGSAYVTGYTRSSKFPVVNSLQPSSRGDFDAFVAQVNAGGSGLVYSTYLGGTAGDFGTGIAVDSAGNAYVTGYTDSGDFPVKNPLQAVTGGGTDAFIARVNASGLALDYSTFVGGTGRDRGLGIAIDSAGNAYVAGDTTSVNLPVTGGLQTQHGGGSTDGIVLKIPLLTGPVCVLSCTATGPSAGKAGVSVSFAATATPANCTGTVNFEWSFGDGTFPVTQQNPVHAYVNPGTYTWTMTAKVTDGVQCIKTGTIQISPNPPRRRP